MAAAIEFNCTCGATLSPPSCMAGQKIYCETCKNWIAIPRAGTNGLPIPSAVPFSEPSFPELPSPSAQSFPAPSATPLSEANPIDPMGAHHSVERCGDCKKEYRPGSYVHLGGACPHCGWSPGVNIRCCTVCGQSLHQYFRKDFRNPAVAAACVSLFCLGAQFNILYLPLAFILFLTSISYFVSFLTVRYVCYTCKKNKMDQLGIGERNRVDELRSRFLVRCLLALFASLFVGAGWSFFFGFG